jgi:hypothetical protein
MTTDDTAAQTSQARSDAKQAAIEASAKSQPIPTKPTVEDHKARLKTPPADFMAAKCMKSWPVGAEISEAEYLQAIHDATHAELR